MPWCQDEAATKAKPSPTTPAAKNKAAKKQDKPPASPAAAANKPQGRPPQSAAAKAKHPIKGGVTTAAEAPLVTEAEAAAAAAAAPVSDLEPDACCIGLRAADKAHVHSEPPRFPFATLADTCVSLGGAAYR